MGKNDIKTAIKGLLNLLKGKTPRPARLTNMTVGADDAKIISNYLIQPEKWQDEIVICAFEESFAKKQGVPFAFSFMGARVALSAIISALGLVQGDEVLVPAYTCVVVPNAFWYKGIKVHFYDIESESYGPSLASLKSSFANHPTVKAVVTHHLFGLVAKEYEDVINFCRSKGLWVIEDCAHSIGLKMDGIMVGNLGDAAFFSMEHSKIISTFNGGVATTNIPTVAKGIADYQSKAVFPSATRLEALLDSFLHGYYTTRAPLNWLTFGYKAKRHRKNLLQSTTKQEMASSEPDYYGQRLPAPLAAVGLNQLGKLEELNEKRRVSAEKWGRWCDENNFDRPYVRPGSEPVFLRYPVMVTPEMKANHIWSKELHIELGVWFTSPIHPVPFEVDDCPNALEAVARCINFPTLNY